MIAMNSHAEFVDTEGPRFLKLRGNVGQIRADFAMEGKSYDWDSATRRKCKGCGSEIPEGRSMSARYCSDECRNKASWRRRKEARVSEPLRAVMERRAR